MIGCISSSRSCVTILGTFAEFAVATAKVGMSPIYPGILVSVPEGATDAALTPYHVARSKLFVRERFGKIGLSQINSSQIEANIEHISGTPRRGARANGRSSGTLTCGGSDRPTRRHQLFAQDGRVVCRIPRNRHERKA